MSWFITFGGSSTWRS